MVDFGPPLSTPEYLELQARDAMPDLFYRFLRATDISSHKTIRFSPICP
jgi:hypothetical protein